MYIAENKTDKVLKVRKKTWAWMRIEPGQKIESKEELIGFEGVEIKKKKEVKKNGS